MKIFLIGNMLTKITYLLLLKRFHKKKNDARHLVYIHVFIFKSL